MKTSTLFKLLAIFCLISLSWAAQEVSSDNEDLEKDFNSFLQTGQNYEAQLRRNEARVRYFEKRKNDYLKSYRGRMENQQKQYLATAYNALNDGKRKAAYWCSAGRVTNVLNNLKKFEGYAASELKTFKSWKSKHASAQIAIEQAKQQREDALNRRDEFNAYKYREMHLKLSRKQITGAQWHAFLRVRSASNGEYSRAHNNYNAKYRIYNNARNQMRNSYTRYISQKVNAATQENYKWVNEQSCDLYKKYFLKEAETHVNSEKAWDFRLMQLDIDQIEDRYDQICQADDRSERYHQSTLEWNRVLQNRYLRREKYNQRNRESTEKRYIINDRTGIQWTHCGVMNGLRQRWWNSLRRYYLDEKTYYNMVDAKKGDYYGCRSDVYQKWFHRDYIFNWNVADRQHFESQDMRLANHVESQTYHKKRNFVASITQECNVANSWKNRWRNELDAINNLAQQRADSLNNVYARINEWRKKRDNISSITGGACEDVTFYSQCNFKGARTIMNRNNKCLNWQLGSVCVPKGLTVTLFDGCHWKGQKATFTKSVKCINKGNFKMLVQSKQIKLTPISTSFLENQNLKSTEDCLVPYN